MMRCQRQRGENWRKFLSTTETPQEGLFDSHFVGRNVPPSEGNRRETRNCWDEREKYVLCVYCVCSCVFFVRRWSFVCVCGRSAHRLVFSFVPSNDPDSLRSCLPPMVFSDAISFFSCRYKNQKKCIVIPGKFHPHNPNYVPIRFLPP